MVVAIFNTCGRFLSGFLSDRIGRTNTMVLAFVLQAINMFMFIQYKTPGLLLFGSAFTGLCYGTIFTLFPAATADFYGVRNLGVNYGSLFTAFGVAGVTGSVLGGRVRDLFGSYTYAFITCGVMLLLGAVLAFALRAPKIEPSLSAPASPGDAVPRGRTEALR
jgi:OFA family oxalate/formate antiporter-like MFS transporter